MSVRALRRRRGAPRWALASAVVTCALGALGVTGAPAVLAASPSPVAATPQASRTPVPPGGPWWVPVGLRGRAVTAVAAKGLRIAASVGDAHLLSDDGGAHFIAAACAPPDCFTPPSAAAVTGASVVVRTPTDVFAVRDGRVLHGGPTGAPSADPGSPDLGRGASLLAASASTPGTAVAVSTDGTVWRRTSSGNWSRALLLLPQGLTLGPPRVTSVAAFSEQPLSRAIYLGTDGYSMLQSDDGGDDWIRAGPGLPDRVLALATDASAGNLYAGTDDGLWVHHLQVEPRPPVYPDAQLLSRWLGIVGVCIAGCAASLVLLRATLR